jgi:benzoyl-CoA reductase/2-hydroxyglutaryl-CoA dehydratase subunit BcrC/BadD/HgdB
MPESNSAASQLAWHYENPMAQALEAHRAGVPVVGVTSNTVPWELIRAAGFFPVMLHPAQRATPAADEYMERDVFQSRIRGIFDSVVRGEWDFLRAIIFPRTSEQEYKLFLYLREVGRERPRDGIPPVHLYDLLHSRSAESHAYGINRTAELKKQLEEIAGRLMATSDLVEAVAESNGARAAVRALLRLRHGTPRLSGVDALPLIGAHWFMGRQDYAKLATEAAEAFARRKPLTGARLLVVGAPLDHGWPHAALEAHGAIVIAEDDWWGARSVGADINAGDNILKAIFEHYYSDAPSPRVYPPEAGDRWFQSSATDGVDGVVFYLPPEDYVAGWDYPRQKRLLDDAGIPSFVFREGPGTGELSSQSHESVERFVQEVARKR